MALEGNDHLVISLISGVLRFPCLFASDFVFDDKVAILENNDVWDTESNFANIFTSHDFWGK